MRHKKYHLSFWFLLLLSTLLISTTNAQTSYLDSLDGKFALQFQISDNLTLSSFQGATISGKYHLGIRSAVRLGISVGLNDTGSDRKVMYSDTLNFYEDAESNSISFYINSQYLNYLVRTDVIGFYLGTGPTVGFENYESDNNISINDSTIQKVTSSGESFTVGLDAIAGVEWSFNKDMSLSAEYGFKFAYTHESVNNDNPSRQDERKTDRFSLADHYIKFGISVYF